MAQQTKPEVPHDQDTTRECTDSLVRTVAAKLLHYQLDRGRRRTARETILLLAGLAAFAVGAAAVWYNWSAIVALFDTLFTPSYPGRN